MKTYKQFNQELNERVNLKPIIKTVSKLITKTKKPPRSIDPFFANKAVERGTMVRGFHGQSAKKIAQYKKTGVTPTVSGIRSDPMKQYKNNPATLDWIKRTGYQGSSTNQKMARPGIDAYFATATKEGKRQASLYAKRGARYQNEKLKNILNPRKDKGEVMDVVVKKNSIRKSWKNLKTAGTETERIAKAQDIIPVVPGPSSRIAKYRLMQLKKTKHQNLSKKNNIA